MRHFPLDEQYERKEAELVAANLPGMIDVFDEIKLKSWPSPADVREQFRRAFERNAALDADDLAVTTSGGRVTVEGAVNSWTGHDEALSTAWASPRRQRRRGSHSRRVLARTSQ